MRRAAQIRRASTRHPERAAAFAANEGPRWRSPLLQPSACALSPSKPTPTPIFLFSLQTKTLPQIDPWASLGRRLGGPWATLGPPKGHPIPDPIPESAEGRKVFKNTKRNGFPLRLTLIRETISPSSPDSSKYNAKNQWRLPTIFYNVAGYNPLWLMYERFSQDARRAVFFADREARQAGSPYLEPEHLLLGLTHKADSKANQLFALAAHLESFRKHLEAVAPLKASKPVDVPVSNICKRVLAHTVEEADQLGSRQIGTEHLLLGLLRENESRAAELLASAGIHLHIARNRVRQDAGMPI